MDITFLFYGSAVALGIFLAVRKVKKQKKREKMIDKFLEQNVNQDKID